jgi:hypothetical protein
VPLIGTCGGIRTPCARRQLLYRQPRLTLFASHAWHHGLREQDSNLQSRINNPLVYRLTDRELMRRHERAGIIQTADLLVRVCSVSANWLRGQDLNLQRPGYEPGGLPNCPTAHDVPRTPGESRTPDNLLVRQELFR